MNRTATRRWFGVDRIPSPGFSGASRGGWRSSARLHVVRHAMAQALIRTTFARGRPVTAVNPQRSGIGPHGSRVAFALTLWSASLCRLSSARKVGLMCGTKKVHFEMNFPRATPQKVISKWRNDVSKSPSHRAARQQGRIEIAPRSCRTTKFHFERTRRSCRTMRTCQQIHSRVVPHGKTSFRYDRWPCRTTRPCSTNPPRVVPHEKISFR